MKSKITFVVALLFFTFNFTNAQGKLNRAKEDLSGNSSRSSSSSRSSWSDDNGGNDGIGYFDSVFIEIAYHATIGILLGEMQPRYFFEYPYSDGSHGEYAFPDENVPLKRSQLIISNTFFTSGKEFYGNDLKLNFRFIPLLGIEASHLHFFEENPKVELGVSSFMINYYRVREQNVTAYWGIGATHVGNGVDDTGLAYQVGVDVYLNKPFSWPSGLDCPPSDREVPGSIPDRVKSKTLKLVSVPSLLGSWYRESAEESRGCNSDPGYKLVILLLSYLSGRYFIPSSTQSTIIIYSQTQSTC